METLNSLVIANQSESGWLDFRSMFDRHYDEVISQLGQPEALLIFGPGEAKLRLKERLGRSKALSEHIVGIETTDKLTEPQIVAKVKKYFGIDG